MNRKIYKDNDKNQLETNLQVLIIYGGWWRYKKAGL